MPLLKQLSNFIRYFHKGNSLDSDTSLRETIEDLIEDPQLAESSIESDERELLGNVLNLRDLTASDVMLPRTDIVSAPITINSDDLISLFVKNRVDYIPIYQGTLDNVIGMVYIKDILEWVHGKTVFRLRPMLKEILFISPSMRTLDLLLRMRETGTKLAIVVDEYGGVDGLVTFSNVIEEVIGDIRNAQERSSPPSVQTRGDGSFIADGRTHLKDLQNLMGIDLGLEDLEEDVDTLGGLVISLAGHVPERGTLVQHPLGIDLEILESDPRRVRLVALRIQGGQYVFAKVVNSNLSSVDH